MEKAREGNYDLLRIICCIAVISIHVSSIWFQAITEESIFFGQLYLRGMLTTCIYDVGPSFAVPCFVMLTGAFALSDERNSQYRYYYRKIFKSIAIPTLIFSIFYFFYNIMLKVWDGGSAWDLLIAVRELISGKPFAHMWYLSMMTGVYLMVPLVIRFRQQVGGKVFSRVARVFMVLAVLGDCTSNSALAWDIGVSFRYIGYLMVGYELRRIESRSNKRGILFIGIGALVLVLDAVLQYKQILMGIDDGWLKDFFLGYLTPLIAISAILIFAGFSCLRVKKNFSMVSGLTFMIYLIHPAILMFARFVIRRYGYEWDNRIVIPVCIFAVFMMSLASSKIYCNVWKWMEDKWDISNRLACLVKLQ